MSRSPTAASAVEQVGPVYTALDMGRVGLLPVRACAAASAVGHTTVVGTSQTALAPLMDAIMLAKARTTDSLKWPRKLCVWHIAPLLCMSYVAV